MDFHAEISIVVPPNFAKNPRREFGKGLVIVRLRFGKARQPLSNAPCIASSDAARWRIMRPSGVRTSNHNGIPVVRGNHGMALRLDDRGLHFAHCQALPGLASEPRIMLNAASIWGILVWAERRFYW
jgi:hypothetical protein